MWNWGGIVVYMVIDILSGAIFALPLVWVVLALCGERGIRRGLLAGLFTLYLCAMFDVVGIPGLPYFRWVPSINLIPFGDEKNTRFFFQVGMNAVMFLPFGFLLPLLWQKCRSWKVTTLAGLLTSGLIEFLQLFSFRATDVDDLLMNTLGTFLGYGLAWLLFHRRWLRPERCRKHEWLELAGTILIPLLVIIFLRSRVSEWVYQLPMFS